MTKEEQQEENGLLKKPKYSGGNKSPEELRKEVEELEAAQAAETQGEEEKETAEPASAEEKVWKKRYADQQRYIQEIKDNNKKELDTLAQKVKELEESKGPMQLPRTPEELAEFREKAPDVYGTIETLVTQGQQKTKEELERQAELLRQGQEKLERESTEIKLLRLHPDLKEINESSEFANWIQGKSNRVREAIEQTLFVESDAEEAAKVLDSFKAETGFGKPKRGRPKKEDESSAAEAIQGTRTSEPQGEDGKIWKESDFKNIPDKEFRSLEPEIYKAMREGRFVYDITGGKSS